MTISKLCDLINDNNNNISVFIMHGKRNSRLDMNFLKSDGNKKLFQTIRDKIPVTTDLRIHCLTKNEFLAKVFKYKVYEFFTNRKKTIGYVIIEDDI